MWTTFSGQRNKEMKRRKKTGTEVVTHPVQERETEQVRLKY